MDLKFGNAHIHHLQKNFYQNTAKDKQPLGQLQMED